MESMESHKTTILDTLKSQLDVFQNRFVDETTKYVAIANKAELELSQVQNEAQQDARRITALEREVASLRNADQDYTDEGTQTIRPLFSKLEAQLSRVTDAPHDQTHEAEAVHDESFDQLQRDYAELSQDYAHLAVAHERLEEKHQSYQGTVRQWREWYEWHGKYGKRMSRNKAGSDRTPTVHLGGSETQASSAPIVFLPSSGTEHQPAPRATSLQTSFGLGGRNDGLQAMVNLGATEPLLAAVGHSALEGDDSTETSDETQDAVASVSKLEDKPSSSAKAAPLPEASEGSSPIIVSARSVKRKRVRHSSPTTVAFKRPTHASERPGTAEKPMQLKSDQSSSSPLAAVRFRTLDEHDSVDLDEVGERNFTPRKRQRVDPKRSRYLELEPIHFTRTKAFLDECISRKDVTDEKAGSDVETHNQGASPSASLDEESCKKAGEEYAANLWKEQIEKASRRRQGNTKDDVDVPEHLRGDSRRMRAYQQNQKMHKRQAESKDKQRITPGGLANPSKTPKGAIYRDRLSNVGVVGLPTPVSSIRRPHAVWDSSNGQKTPSILRPTDPNTHNILPRTGGSTKKRPPPPSRRNHGAAAVHLLSEDGDVKDKLSTMVVAKVPRAPEAEHRLGGLLSEPSSDKPILPWKSPTLQEKTYIKQPDAPSPKTQPAVAKSSTRPVTPVQLPANEAKTTRLRIPTVNMAPLFTKPATRPVLASVSPLKAPTSPEKGPIRFRPLGTLDLKHFKLNPAQNSGYSYAYREVIRKRKERKCLPGCTRPDCCGDKIRKMLAIGGALPSNYANLFSSSPEDPGKDGAEDHRLLKEYMGDNYRQWRKMSESEKKKEWMRAQEWNCGKAFGRHKDNGRQATPPGFWRVEMASTQEMAKDEEEAERMERERVEGMWREAMRKDGAYLFADE